MFKKTICLVEKRLKLFIFTKKSIRYTLSKSDRFCLRKHMTKNFDKFKCTCDSEYKLKDN